MYFPWRSILVHPIQECAVSATSESSNRFLCHSKPEQRRGTGTSQWSTGASSLSFILPETRYRNPGATSCSHLRTLHSDEPQFFY